MSTATRDYWVVCTDYVSGPYGRQDAGWRLDRYNHSDCPSAHAIIRQRSERSAVSLRDYGPNDEEQWIADQDRLAQSLTERGIADYPVRDCCYEAGQPHMNEHVHNFTDRVSVPQRFAGAVTGHAECISCECGQTISLDEFRRQLVESGQPQADLTADTDRHWTTDQVREEFEVEGFAAPFVVVRRRADGARGTLEFTHSPRVYFGWRADA